MLLTAPLVSSTQAPLEETTEWIIPYAGGPSSDAADDAAVTAVWGGLELPHLQSLLALMQPAPAQTGTEMDFSPPPRTRPGALAGPARCAGPDCLGRLAGR